MDLAAGRGSSKLAQQMPVVPVIRGEHDKPASHSLMKGSQDEPLGTACAESSDDDARNAAQINKGKPKRLIMI